ncbi:MAG: CHAT domain-containing protein, partial [Pyrinomonadaceae bacterium]
LFLEKELVNEIGTENAKTLAADRDQQRVREWGSGTVALTTVITENRYRVVLTTPTVQIDGKTDISAAVLNRKVFAFRQALQNTATDPRQIGKELYDILIKPIEKELAASGAKTLVWSLDGTLRYIPISALSPDGKTYLVERFQNVMITPKTRERVSRHDAGWRALGMGVSEEQTLADLDGTGQRITLEALPSAKRELTSIIRDETDPANNGIFDGRRFLDDEFTMDNLTRSLARKNQDNTKHFNVVHLATHFRLGETWASSFLIIGGGKTLTLQQMSTLPEIDFAGVELTTLSACNTAIVTAASGIEVDSLAESIQSKGGKAVLATLWNVYDESTEKLMSGFYRFKKDDPSITKADALQRAQAKMIASADFSHPYFWSGFTLIGNWR